MRYFTVIKSNHVTEDEVKVETPMVTIFGTTAKEVLELFESYLSTCNGRFTRVGKVEYSDGFNYSYRLEEV